MVAGETAVQSHIIEDVFLVITVRHNPDIEISGIERAAMQSVLGHDALISHTKGNYRFGETIRTFKPDGIKHVVTTERSLGNLGDLLNSIYRRGGQTVVFSEIGPVTGVYAHLEGSALLRAEHEVHLRMEGITRASLQI